MPPSRSGKIYENLSLLSLIHKPTCFKKVEGRCIDLFLTNKWRSFQKSNSFETGISDHHHLIYTILKSAYKRARPQIINYRRFKEFSLESFQQDLAFVLSKMGADFTSFYKALEKVLDAHAPKKSRVIRGNHKPHVTKEMRKAIMKRSFYKNKVNQTGDFHYKKLYKNQKIL